MSEKIKRVSLENLSTFADELKARYAKQGDIPTKVSELENDAKFQTEEQVAAAMAAAAHLKRKKVDSVDDIDPAAEGADQYIYMVLKSSGKNGDKYDEYMVLDGEVERVGDWAVNLSGYVEKVDGKDLSSNDYTDEDKAKLASVAEGSTKVEASETNGNIKINGVEKPVYTLPDTVLHQDDFEEITEAEIAALFDD